MKGSELRALRLRMGCTQKQLAQQVGVTKNTVARWERDELGMRASAERLIRLLAAQHKPQRRKK